MPELLDTRAYRYHSGVTIPITGKEARWSWHSLPCNSNEFPVAKQKKSTRHSPHHRFVIALRFAVGVVETGLPLGPSEKRATKLACGAKWDTFSIPVCEQNLQNCGYFPRFSEECSQVSLHPRLRGGGYPEVVQKRASGKLRSRLHDPKLTCHRNSGRLDPERPLALVCPLVLLYDSLPHSRIHWQAGTFS